MKKKRQSDSDVFRERWFVVKNGVLSYYRDRKVSPKNIHFLESVGSPIAV